VTPASARDLRRARVAELRQAEPDLSHREMAQRLGISKDTVRRDLEALDAEAAQTAPATEKPLAQTAPQVNGHGAPERAPDAPAAGLPRRDADPLAGMDVSQWRALRRDLAVLAQTGRSAEALVHQAVTAVAFSYRQALTRGQLQPGQPFLISAMQLRPAAQLGDRPVPALAERP
jgi:DNA-binding transcriptional MocR family regulator